MIVMLANGYYSSAIHDSHVMLILGSGKQENIKVLPSFNSESLTHCNQRNMFSCFEMVQKVSMCWILKYVLTLMMHIITNATYIVPKMLRNYEVDH